METEAIYQLKTKEKQKIFIIAANGIYRGKSEAEVKNELIKDIVTNNTENFKIEQIRQ